MAILCFPARMKLIKLIVLLKSKEHNNNVSNNNKENRNNNNNKENNQIKEIKNEKKNAIIINKSLTDKSKTISNILNNNIKIVILYQNKQMKRKLLIIQ